MFNIWGWKIEVKKFIILRRVMFTICSFFINIKGWSWLWSYDSWIYNYLCNQYLSPLTLWVLISFRRYKICDKVCQWLVTGRWFSPVPSASSTNKTDHHDILVTESGIEHHKPQTSSISNNNLSYLSVIKVFFNRQVIGVYSLTCLKGHLYIAIQSIKGSLIFPINE